MEEEDIKREFIERVQRRRALARLLGKGLASKLINAGLDDEEKVASASASDLAEVDLTDMDLARIARYVGFSD